jgi:hypothetical protein
VGLFSCRVKKRRFDFAEVGFTIGKLLPEKEKGFSPIFNFGIEAESLIWLGFALRV